MTNDRAAKRWVQDGMSTLLFRKLRPDEFDVAYGILVSAADWLISKGIRQWTNAYPKELYRAHQDNGWNYGLVSDGRLAVIVTLSWEIPAGWVDHFGTTPVWWLSKLATAPSHRGHALGSLAVRHVIDTLADQGIDRLCLDCVHASGFLVDFYQGLGFRTIDRRDVQFATGLFDMVLMELKIPKVT